MRVTAVVMGAGFFSLAFAGFLAYARAWWLAAAFAAEGALMVYVGWRLGRRAASTEGPGEAPARAVPPLPSGVDPDEVDLSGVPMPAEACARCGHLGVHAPRLAEGGIPGVAETMDLRVCPRCGHRGLAAFFETQEEYRDFLKELGASRAASASGSP